jgi:DNA uptake protein ComE-like DNA-binding protein
VIDSCLNGFHCLDGKRIKSARFSNKPLSVIDLEKLYDELVPTVGSDWATFIIAYRQSGPYDGEEEGKVASGELDFNQAGQTKISQILDLIGKKTQVRFSGSNQPVVLASPFPAELVPMSMYMHKLMDNLTVTTGAVIPGRININQAPRAILMGIPGITEEMVDQILDTRPADPSTAGDNANLTHETWLLTEGVLLNEEGQPDVTKMKTLMPFCCAGGDVFRAQIIGYFQGGGSSSRVEVVFDNTEAVPRVVFWRDLSHLGRGFNLETLGVDLTGRVY